MTESDYSHVDAVLFDFTGVVGTIRMAFAGEEGRGPYRVVPYDDVVDGIRRLREAGVRTALVSNNDRDRFFDELAPATLAGVFDTTVFSSDIGVSKPHPLIFRSALEKTGVVAHRALFLDDVARNVDAAEDSGMRGVVIDDPSTTVSVIDAVISSRRP